MAALRHSTVTKTKPARNFPEPLVVISTLATLCNRLGRGSRYKVARPSEQGLGPQRGLCNVDIFEQRSGRIPGASTRGGLAGCRRHRHSPRTGVAQYRSSFGRRLGRGVRLAPRRVGACLVLRGGSPFKEPFWLANHSDAEHLHRLVPPAARSAAGIARSLLVRARADAGGRLVRRGRAAICVRHVRRRHPGP